MRGQKGQFFCECPGSLGRVQLKTPWDAGKRRAQARPTGRHSCQPLLCRLWTLALQLNSCEEILPLRQEKGIQGLPDGSADKQSTCNAGDTGGLGSSPGLGRTPGEGNGNPLQYSCQENSTDREAWRATLQRVSKDLTRLSD